MNYIPSCTSKLRNKYYANKDEYDKIKRNLLESQINFKCADIYNLPNVFNGNYDKILLSNISDYLKFTTKIDSFYHFITNDLGNILSDDGEIVAAYIYHYILNGKKYGIRFKFNPNGDYSIFEKNFKVIKVNNVDVCNYYGLDDKDAVLVYKKSKNFYVVFLFNLVIQLCLN